MAHMWIVVADSAQARIFSAEKGKNGLEEKTSFLHPASRAAERELTTDEPGRAFDSQGAGRHAMGSTVSPKEHEAELFSKVLADELEAARVRGTFDRLVLIAAPAFLGLLRKGLTDSTSRLVQYELDKNIARESAEEIRGHLPDELFR